MSTAGGFAVKFGARFLFLFVAGHLYGAVLFGAFSVAIAVVEALIGLAGLSLKKTLFQMLDDNRGTSARAPLHVVLDAVLLVLGVGGSLSVAVMLLAICGPPGLIGQATATALFWVAPLIVSQSLADLLFASIRWQNTVSAEVIGRSLVEPYIMVAGAAVSYLAGLQEHGLIIGYWLGNIALNAYAIRQVRRFYGSYCSARYRLNIVALQRTLRQLLPNTATEFANGVYARLDLYLVSILLGERWAGIYAMAQQIRTPVRQVRQSFDSLLIPLVSRTIIARGAASAQDAIASVGRLILAIQLPILLVLGAGGSLLLDLLGKGFGAAYWALLFLVLAEVINGSFGLGDLLFVYRRPAEGLRITLLTAAVGLVTGYVLISEFGITGAGLSVLLAYGFQACLRRATLKAHFNSRVPLTYSAGPILSCVVAAALVVGGGDLIPRGWWSAVILGLGGLVAYAAVLWLWITLTGARISIAEFAVEAEAETARAAPHAGRADLQ